MRPDEGSETSNSRMHELGRQVSGLAESAKEGVERLAASLPVPPLPLLAPEERTRGRRATKKRSGRKAAAKRGGAKKTGAKKTGAAKVSTSKKARRTP